MDTVGRNGEVIGLESEEALIRLVPANGCSHCASRAGCSARPQLIRLPRVAGLRIGSQVSVSTSAASLAGAAMLGYLLPPAMMLGGALLTTLANESDALAILGASFGFASGLFLVRWIARQSPAQRFAAVVRESENFPSSVTCPPLVPENPNE